mmetsp:Transcript_5357/g.12936  ORF Transcript_5357/g.12936 Transcript_5357/m.12936 type:complete len:226 (+) Transcript_5357:79-756(+)
MDPFFVPAAGVLVATGIIGGGQVAEDWDEPDGFKQKLYRWDPLNFLKSDADQVRRQRDSYGAPPPGGTVVRSSNTGVSLGFFFTRTTPHLVDEVVSLVDRNGVRMGSPGYANPPILPGDKILYIEDMKADMAPTEAVKSALQGGRPTTVTITFQRGEGQPFTATLMRHNLSGAQQAPSSPRAAVRRYTAPATSTPGYYNSPPTTSPGGPQYGVPYRKDMALVGEI